MTINKSQDQTIEQKVEIHLQEAVFFEGQINKEAYEQLTMLV